MQERDLTITKEYYQEILTRYNKTKNPDITEIDLLARYIAKLEKVEEDDVTIKTIITPKRANGMIIIHYVVEKE